MIRIMTSLIRVLFNFVLLIKHQSDKGVLKFKWFEGVVLRSFKNFAFLIKHQNDKGVLKFKWSSNLESHLNLKSSKFKVKVNVQMMWGKSLQIRRVMGCTNRETVLLLILRGLSHSSIFLLAFIHFSFDNNSFDCFSGQKIFRTTMNCPISRMAEKFFNRPISKGCF